MIGVLATGKAQNTSKGVQKIDQNKPFLNVKSFFDAVCAPSDNVPKTFKAAI